MPWGGIIGAPGGSAGPMPGGGGLYGSGGGSAGEGGAIGGNASCVWTAGVGSAAETNPPDNSKSPVAAQCLTLCIMRLLNFCLCVPAKVARRTAFNWLAA